MTDSLYSKELIEEIKARPLLKAQRAIVRWYEIVGVQCYIDRKRLSMVHEIEWSNTEIVVRFKGRCPWVWGNHAFKCIYPDGWVYEVSGKVKRRNRELYIQIGQKSI